MILDLFNASFIFAEKFEITYLKILTFTWSNSIYFKSTLRNVIHIFVMVLRWVSCYDYVQKWTSIINTKIYHFFQKFLEYVVPLNQFLNTFNVNITEIFFWYELQISATTFQAFGGPIFTIFTIVNVNNNAKSSKVVLLYVYTQKNTQRFNA